MNDLPANVTYLYVDDFVDFPQFNGKSNKYADFNNKIGFVVENVQQDNKWLKDIEENRSHWQALEWLAVSPELNICSTQTADMVMQAISTALCVRCIKSLA